MRKSPGKIFLLLFLFILFCVASEARADTVVITSGSINFTNTSVNNSFSLAGDGLSVQGRTNYLFLGYTFVDTDFTSSVPLGRTLDNDDLNVDPPFTLSGVTYTSWQNQYDSLRLDISAGEFTFPVDPSITSVTFTNTFTMEGNILLPEVSHPGNGQSVGLTGQGIATAIYTRDPNFPNHWRLQNLNYTFQTTPTPEPASLLLLMTGIGGAAIKVYRRRKAGKEE
jgi:hypothetical protein